MTQRAILLAALFGVAPAAHATDAGPTPAAVAAPAQTALTPGTERDFFAYIEWTFAARLTAAQRAEGTHLLAQAYAEKSEPQMTIVQDAVLAFNDLANHSDADKQALRASVEDEYLKSLKLRYRTQPLAKWISGVKDARDKTLSPGPPPLTRLSAEAFGELMAFVVKEARVGAVPETDRKYFDDFARALTADYKGYSEEQRISLMEMPNSWAALRTGWAGYPEDKKAKLREEWRSAFKAGADAGSTPPFTADGKPLREAARMLAAKVAGWL
ncbi:MAG: hypothetical protein ACOZIN_12050 [Myxococcota bacterium]